MAAPIAPAAGNPFAGTYQAGPAVNPFGDRPEQIPNPYTSPGVPVVGPQSYLRPHRGGMILTFSIIGVLCCMPFCIAAWVMGATDLKEIRAGRMDPGGQGMTQAGMIIGIVGTVLGAIGVLIQIGILAANAM